ncbi:MAG TPA: hypothetical protein VMG31_16610 [Verrucomicrobiae bacterium]|nr:hypothetical protein [Verrucomicrobiae bacterium]
MPNWLGTASKAVTRGDGFRAVYKGRQKRLVERIATGSHLPAGKTIQVLTGTL